MNIALHGMRSSFLEKFQNNLKIFFKFYFYKNKIILVNFVN